MQRADVRMGIKIQHVLSQSKGGGTLGRFGLACMTVVGLWVCACGLPEEQDYFGPVPEPDVNHFKWCNSGEPEWVDPALTTSTTGSPIARLMFSGLTDMGTDVWGKSVPSIAESWDFDDDLRRFTFHLRDDVVWSNQRRLTSADFVYHVARILHPTTTSRNTESLKFIKNGKLFNKERVKILQKDVPPFAKGDFVEIIGLDGNIAESIDKLEIPSSNRRTSSKDLKLRDKGASEKQSYATVPAGTEIDLVDRSKDGSWSYVYFQGEMFQWFYGWVPSSELDGQPNHDVQYTIRGINKENTLFVSETSASTDVFKKGVAKGVDLVMTSEVLGIYERGPTTLVLETNAPIPYIHDITQSRALRPTPRESVSRAPQKWTQPSKGLLVTSGPFTMTEWKVRDHMTLIKSESHFNKDLVNVDKFTVFSIDEQSASANLYFSGECDATTSNTIPTTYIPLLNGIKRGGRRYKDFYNEPYDGSYFYTFNTEKITNVHFRRALAHAVDRSQIPTILQGGQIPSTSFVPGISAKNLSEEDLKACGLEKDSKRVGRVIESGKLCYRPPLGPEFNLEKAKAEMALAKKEMGDDFKNTVEAKYNIGNEGNKLVAEFLQNQWKENLGLEVTLSTMEWKTYLEQTSAGNFEMARYGWIGATPHPEFSFHLYFLCDSPYNRARFCNKKYDALFNEARNETDPVKRLRILEEAESIVLNEAPFVPLYIYTQQRMMRPYVRDFPMHMGDQPPLWRVWLDPDWKQKEARK